MLKLANLVGIKNMTMGQRVSSAAGVGHNQGVTRRTPNARQVYSESFDVHGEEIIRKVMHAPPV